MHGKFHFMVILREVDAVADMKPIHDTALWRFHGRITLPEIIRQIQSAISFNFLHLLHHGGFHPFAGRHLALKHFKHRDVLGVFIIVKPVAVLLGHSYRLSG